MKKITFCFVIAMLSTMAFAKPINLHCAKDSEFDLTDLNKNDSIHDYLVHMDLDDEGLGEVLFFRYQNYPNRGPDGRSFNTSGHDREHKWFKVRENSRLGGSLYLWEITYNVYTNWWGLNRKTLELETITKWAGYNTNYEKRFTAAECRIVDSLETLFSLGDQIKTFHIEFLERQKEKARKEAEAKEKEFSI